MRSLNFLIKPASSLCNLRCRYCFYRDEAENRSCSSMGLMTRQTAELLLEEAFSNLDPHGLVQFAFQGGEPTLAGLDFFRHFVAQARRRCPPDSRVTFSIQTNGMLLNEDWARFLREEAFLVGLSLDGFKECHNACRVDAAGNGSWNRVTKALTLLQQQGVEVNALCVVTAACARSPEKAYRTLKKLGFRYLQFIACLDPLQEERGTQPYSLTPEAYGRFLCRLFDLWYADWLNGDYHSVRLFDDYVHILLGDGASTCATCGRCGSYFVVEADGSVYPCDFFVLDPWRMGRLGEVSLSQMANGETARRFAEQSRTLPAACAACPWGGICHGGCRNDWVRIDGQPGNYHCAALRALLDHAMPRLSRIARAEAEAMR